MNIKNNLSKFSSPPAGQSSVASPAAAAQVLEFEAVTGALAAEGQHWTWTQLFLLNPKNIFASVLQVFFAFQIAMEIESQRIYNLNCVPLKKRDKVETRKIWSLEIIWFVWCLNYSALSVYPRVSHQLHWRGRLSNGVSKYKESAEL